MILFRFLINSSGFIHCVANYSNLQHFFVTLRPVRNERSHWAQTTLSLSLPPSLSIDNHLNALNRGVVRLCNFFFCSFAVSQFVFNWRPHWKSNKLYTMKNRTPRWEKKGILRSVLKNKPKTVFFFEKNASECNA